VARAIVAAGLIPSIGVFHRNRGNPFCLADDLLEPYRPYVDWKVRIVATERGGEPWSLDDRTVRAALLSILNETVAVGGRRLPMLLGIQASAASLCRALTGEAPDLALPTGLPLAPDQLALEGDG
jgi:CRISPR-associated protein Cas1